MIFVSVGTNFKSFDRLIDSVCELSSKYSIVIQHGNTILPSDCRVVESFDFSSPEIMRKFISDSELVIAHAGVAIIEECLMLNRRIILVPRMLEFNECVDDQYETAIHYKDDTMVFISNIENLYSDVGKILRIPNLGNKSKNFDTTPYVSDLVDDFINNNE